MSMPSTGFYLFLPLMRDLRRCSLLCVNALNGLLLISSVPNYFTNRHADECVNALNGLLLISSVVPQRDKNVWGIVSMPSTGFYLFLPTATMQAATMNTVCQCPQRASTYFFVTFTCGAILIQDCVNALNGLLLISSQITIPRQKQH